jgi:hypothetical protein
MQAEILLAVRMVFGTDKKFISTNREKLIQLTRNFDANADTESGLTAALTRVFLSANSHLEFVEEVLLSQHDSLKKLGKLPRAIRVVAFLACF